MDLFLIYSFIQFAVVVSFIIFESCHILKFFHYDMQNPLDCNIF
jgi:hypothetical protein